MSKPEAIRLASKLDDVDAPVCDAAAAELRRLHAINAELLEALRALSFAFEVSIHDHEDSGAWQAAQDALRKATGGAEPRTLQTLTGQSIDLAEPWRVPA